jgi:hypothetical protein
VHIVPLFLFLNTTKGASMIDILALLKDLMQSENIYGTPCCHHCGMLASLGMYNEVKEYLHEGDCDLKAAIDALESGSLVVVDIKTVVDYPKVIIEMP